MRETDLIRKANKPLLQSIAYKEMDFGPCSTNINANGYGDNEDDISDDSEVQAEAVSSFFPHKALFKLNFRPIQNEEIITCLAEQSVRNRRQIHPIVLRFLH